MRDGAARADEREGRVSDEVHDVVCCDCLECENWRRAFKSAHGELTNKEAQRLAKAEARVVQLERKVCIMTANELRLRARIAQDQGTLVEIERVCSIHGYNPLRGTTVADWLRRRLGRGVS